MSIDKVAERITELEKELVRVKTTAAIVAAVLLTMTGVEWFMLPGRMLGLVGDDTLVILKQGVKNAGFIAAALESQDGDIRDVQPYSVSRTNTEETIEGKQLCILSLVNFDGNSHRCALSREGPSKWKLSGLSKKDPPNDCIALCFNLLQYPTTQMD